VRPVPSAATPGREQSGPATRDDRPQTARAPAATEPTAALPGRDTKLEAEPARPQPTAWGTQRRLRALMNRSWSPPALEQATGISATVITTILNGGRTPGRAVNECVATAYERLWNKTPPLETARDRQVADQARKLAERRGWPPPLAYDDDLIDLPSGDAEPGWKRSRRTTRKTTDLAEDLAFVREHGGYRHASMAEAAMRLGVTRDALQQVQCRTARADREADTG
jgi:hypothetical protein